MRAESGRPPRPSLRVCELHTQSIGVGAPRVSDASDYAPVSEHVTIATIALQHEHDPIDRRRALRAGFRHFVPKPVEIDELAAVVRTVADQH